MVKGWQYRWFVLEPEAGRLEYHLLEDRSFWKKNDNMGKHLSINLISGMVDAGAVNSLQVQWLSLARRMARPFL